MGTFARYQPRNRTKLSPTKQIFKKMKQIIPLIALFVILASASTDEDNKAVDLAEKLAKAREETKQFVERENEKLRHEDDKIKKENRRLRKEMAKLRRDNSEIKKIQRQKDQNNTMEFRHFFKDSLRQKDSELEKMMKRKIDEYLQENKVCVTGNMEKSPGSSGVNQDYTVDFGHVFAKVPTFSASLMGFTVRFQSVPDYATVQLIVKKVTNSSANVKFWAHSNYNYVKVAWIACM